MKFLLTLALGATIGAFTMHYIDDKGFAARTNAQVDHVVTQGAASAHNALQSTK